MEEIIDEHSEIQQEEEAPPVLQQHANPQDEDDEPQVDTEEDGEEAPLPLSQHPHPQDEDGDADDDEQEDEEAPLLPQQHANPQDGDGDDVEHNVETQEAAAPLRRNVNRRRRDNTALPRANAINSAFFGIFGKWLIFLLLCSGALFFFSITPSFTLHSATSSVLNNITTASAATQNLFTANLTVEILIRDSKWMGILSAPRIYYNDSFRALLFNRQENLTTFSLPISSQQQQEPSKNFTVKAEFPNVPLKLDDWYIDGHGCGYVFLDLNLTAEARYTQPLFPIAREKLQSQCGEVKFELCFSSPSSSSVNATTVVNLVYAGCHVHSDAVTKIRLVQLVILTLVLATALAVPLLVYVILGFMNFNWQVLMN